MVRQRRGGDAEIFPEFANTLDLAAATPAMSPNIAAGAKTPEDQKAVNIRQSLEHLAELFNFFSSIFRHISNYIKKQPAVQDKNRKY